MFFNRRFSEYTSSGGHLDNKGFAAQVFLLLTFLFYATLVQSRMSILFKI